VGQKQGQFIIRSCFGGLDRNFILSGSEDGKIYVWHMETGALIEVLSGHGEGTVNAVAWNSNHPPLFASAGDDHTVCHFS
jgi:WD40 repeat protein